MPQEIFRGLLERLLLFNQPRVTKKNNLKYTYTTYKQVKISLTTS